MTNKTDNVNSVVDMITELPLVSFLLPNDTLLIIMPIRTTVKCLSSNKQVLYQKYMYYFTGFHNNNYCYHYHYYYFHLAYSKLH